MNRVRLPPILPFRSERPEEGFTGEQIISSVAGRGVRDVLRHLLGAATYGITLALAYHFNSAILLDWTETGERYEKHFHFKKYGSIDPCRYRHVCCSGRCSRSR